jgi:hypothetical protein
LELLSIFNGRNIYFDIYNYFMKKMEEYTILEVLARQIAQYFVKERVFRYECPEKLLLDRKLAFIGD